MQAIYMSGISIRSFLHGLSTNASLQENASWDNRVLFYNSGMFKIYIMAKLIRVLCDFRVAVTEMACSSVNSENL